MNRLIQFALGAALALVAIAGCAQSSPDHIANSQTTNFHLQQEPAGAVEVLDAKDQAKDGEPIVVVGRIGGGLKPWIDGRAAFLLVDTRILPSCEEGDKCEADCPDCAKELLAASTMVKFLGEDGKVLSVDARELLRVKDEATVVVRGLASRDKSGNVSIAADGVYVRR